MRRSRWNASISWKTPPGGSASSIRYGKSRSFVRPTISRLRRVISPNPLRLRASLLGAAGHPDPVIREKSQFRAQDDSLSLSPAHDGTQSLSTLPSLGPPFPLGGLFLAQRSTRDAK